MGGLKRLFVIMFLFPAIAMSQITVDFESGTLDGWQQNNDGHWQASADDPISGTMSLHHVFDNTSAASDCIGMPFSTFHPEEGTARWSFRIKYGYKPSASNSWAVFIMSDKDPSSFSDGNVNGYALGVNLAGNDDTLRLWKVKNGIKTTIVNTAINWEKNIGGNEAVGLSVERDVTGKWQVQTFNSGNTLMDSANGTDKELFDIQWFIVNYNYTSSADRLLWFDDLHIEGTFYEDVVPPSVQTVTVLNKNSLQIVFSEAVRTDMLGISSFILKDRNNALSTFEAVNSTTVILVFEEDLRNKENYELEIRQLCDSHNNCSDVIACFMPLWTGTGDIVISEIMADPLPAVSLPGKEYIEIVNRTGYEVDLTGWTLTVGKNSVNFPSVMLSGGQYAVLCHRADTALFSTYGKVIGFRSFPVLNDAGQTVFITDNFGTYIHGVTYSSGWYNNELKNKGGWSLEMVDTDYPFFDYGNWEVSTSKKGGTPGAINSVSMQNPDLSFLGIVNVFPLKSDMLKLVFSEPVFNLEDKTDCLKINGVEIMSIALADPLHCVYHVALKSALTERKEYDLSVEGIRDFAGNHAAVHDFHFGLPEVATTGDVVFNELLFNPFPEEPDYMEFYNVSDKIIDVSTLRLSSENSVTGEMTGLLPLYGEQRVFLPGDYFAITTNRDKVMERYYTHDESAIFNVSSLPSMPDEKGHILLTNKELEKIDEVKYSEDMHYSLLSGVEGISLEKIRPDLPSEQKSAWLSASELSGWGTPGTVNSVFRETENSDDEIVLSSTRITPDNDGYEDVLVMDFSFQDIGNVITVSIFDETGRYVRKITQNMYATSDASVIWDGTDSRGAVVNNGIYVLLIEMYNNTGKTQKWKKTCAVVHNR